MSRVLPLPMRVALPIGLVLALAALGIAAAGAMANSPRAVYTLTNDPAGNAVKVFHRSGHGSLSPGGEFATGGTGTGTGLGNQGALVLDGRRLFAVNPGSDSISSFRVRGHRLELIDTDASGGDQPISLTVDDGLLYVLNAGGAGNITGHTISRHGALSPLVGSTRPLSGAATDPAQVSFDPRGETLVVTEKATNLIDTYEVDGGHGPRQRPEPAGIGGRDAVRLRLRPARAPDRVRGVRRGGRPERGVLLRGRRRPDRSDQSLGRDHRDGRVLDRGDQERALRLHEQHRQRLDLGLPRRHDGALTLLDADGETGLTGPGPIDMALTRSSRFLYSLNSGDGTISGFRVTADGGLAPIGGASGLPAAATGLAAR